MKRLAVSLVAIAFVGGLYAHPHFRKEISADLAGTTAKISYATTPANEDHLSNVDVGGFVTPRGPQLSLSADMMSGSVSIPAGDYTIGVVRKAQDDWAVALYPGRLGRGETPESSELIELESMFSDSAGMHEHMRLDITPGHGALEGRAVLIIEFGSLSCAGALN